ncbi:MAG: SAM-dependent methyltransferase [Anaerolineae bacterium]
MSENLTMNTDVPNAGRVYDYVLGGNHNFEVDRQAAEFMLSLVPSTRKWVRMLRMFMNFSVRRLAEEGFDQFLDFASGLPTVDHIHQTVSGAKVVYTDNDPVTVNFARELIGDNENVRYLETDIRDVEAILNSSAVREIFDLDRKIAVGFNAVSCFLSEEEMAALLADLYAWVPSGSKLYATFETKHPDKITPKMQQFVDMFAQMGSPYHFLTLEESRKLIGPWQVCEPGFRPLAEWLGVEDQITEEDREGVDLEFYGVYLEK